MPKKYEAEKLVVPNLSGGDNLSVIDLLNANLMVKSIYLKSKDIHLGLEADQFLQDLVVKSIVSMPTASEFRQDCRKMMIEYYRTF